MVKIAINTTVRCFRTTEAHTTTGRHGVWLMTGVHRGIFYRGSRDYSEPPRWDVYDLEDGNDMGATEITPDEAIRELSDWPDAIVSAAGVFCRHPAESHA